VIVFVDMRRWYRPFDDPAEDAAVHVA
jgi:hypothetical protein